MEGDRLHRFGGVSFGGVLMAQHWADLYIWEILLNTHPELAGIVELGTWEGGMSRYLWSQAKLREMEFVTFDVVAPPDPPPFFVQLDIYRFPEVVESAAEAMDGPVALFCDGGNKPRELKTFPSLTPAGSIFLVHDWGTETLSSDVPDFLEEIYGDLCDELSSVTRIFRMRGGR